MKNIIWILLAAPCIAQTDAQYFAEGRIAMDKFNDCKGAVSALEKVSPEGQKNPLWLFYAAKATECNNRWQDALKFYEEYDRIMPGQAQIIDKIGELRYKTSRELRQREDQEKRKREEESRAKAARVNDFETPSQEV